MTQPVHIAIIGNFNQDSHSHVATNKALTHTADSLSIPLEYTWLPTETLNDEGAENLLRKFHGLWAAPGSPYASTEGALQAIKSRTRLAVYWYLRGFSTCSVRVCA